MSTHEANFKSFHAANPKVYLAFVQFAEEAVLAGIKLISADSVMHRVRWETSIKTKGSVFKINNNHVAYYARMYLAEHSGCPTRGRLFKTRRVS